MPVMPSIRFVPDQLRNLFYQPGLIDQIRKLGDDNAALPRSEAFRYRSRR